MKYKKDGPAFAADELLELEPMPVDKEKIRQSTFSKLGLETAGGNHAGAAVKKPRRKTLRVLAIAAVIMALSATVAYAASVIYSMSEQGVGYFVPDEKTQTPVSGPTYHEALAMDIEQYNATVGESVTDNGKTVTLDTVAVDDNFINLFFTIGYDKPVDLDGLIDGPYPAHNKLLQVVPGFLVRVDGSELQGGYSTLDEYDPYLEDEQTVKMMVRYLTPTLLPDTFELAVIGQEYNIETGDSSDIKGEFHFDLTIDKSASAAATRAAKPDEYVFASAKGEQRLDLEKLTVTPFGGAISVKGHWDPDGLSFVEGYYGPEDFYITDDKGNVLNTFWNNGVREGDEYYALELMGAAPDAECITLTPLAERQAPAEPESRTYAVADIGAKIELSALGGYIFEDYKIEGRRISFVLRPYGRTNYQGEMIPDDENVTQVEGRTGLITTKLDRKTGLFTYTLDYYGASPEELEAIETFHAYYYDELEKDEAAALTLPLEKLQP